VTGVAFNPVSPHLYSCGSLGSLALHDTRDNKYQLMRLLSSAVARGDARSPGTLTVSGDGRHLAFVGPTDFTITVVDAKSLDEVPDHFLHFRLLIGFTFLRKREFLLTICCFQQGWHFGTLLDHLTCDQEVSSLISGSGQVICTHEPLSPYSIIWYWQKLRCKQAYHVIH